ncbi:hypothetical protein MMC07_007810, partial [Pseudocyphellaria aurata]|nr:hypothetical protein [Pseudocyphellaria aurata]
MPSPPPSFARAVPRRKPLQERSDSHANERTSPTLRLIGDPNARIYSSSPFPSLPSHILSPKTNDDGGQGVVFEDVEDVSDQDGPRFRPEQHEFLATQPISRSKGKEIATVEDDNESEFQYTAAESSLLPSPSLSTPTVGQQSPFTASDVDLDHSPSVAMKRGSVSGERISDEIIQLPSVPGRGEALGSHRFTQDFSLTPLQQPMPSKSSDSSLSSNESTGTVVKTKLQGWPYRGSYAAFPFASQPDSSTSDFSTPPLRAIPRKPVPRRSEPDVSPTSSASPSFLASPNFDRRLTPSISTTVRLQGALQPGEILQYPIVRPPSASQSWAESRSPLTRPPRTVNADRWNPHLSTVDSEDTDDRYSGTMRDRHSGTMWFPESSSGSGRSSHPRNSLSDFSDVPAPLRPAHARRSRDFTGSTIRIVNGSNDNLTALPPIPGSRDSAIYSVLSHKPVRENQRNTMPTRPSTRSSFRGNRRNTLQKRPSSRAYTMRDGIPGWAKTYYARHGSSTEDLSRPDTSASVSTEHHFMSFTRPRNRPHPVYAQNTDHPNRNSLIITQAGDDNILTEIRGEPRRKVSQVWSPHLWHDRRSMGKRRSMFKAPSLEEQAESSALSRRNVQIILFALGFIFPFARDLEKALGQVDGARYENARWWRNLNRLMSVLGFLILAAM